ncbi:hydantoinase B/oxoprolinase family protein [Patulibacter sp. SYSU D01012]|uniref:hydantoinase B/oxoprolinase family protein n=1 Tax=Patulibacter sp. SYSU D01012 TaxID=2817381 RepID=UPI001B310615|nr:hydantoinase B/oxoprolinase family protein [Patulibacter sp. SYSU D01012]
MSTTHARGTDGAVDPITFEVIRHKLWSINEEGSQTMTHVSGSPVVHATDYNFGIYAADGEMAVVGVYLLVPIYTGAMAIREFLARFDDIAEGDVFIVNDPYIAAEHQNDVQFCAPFFHDGELVAWIGCMAHQVDLGGMDAGSWCPTATDVFQEGLRIPPGRIVRRGEVNRELWDVVIANSRMPFVVSNDFTAFLAGLKVSGERLTELCDRYGGATVKAVMGQSIEASERGLRELLSTLPDGTFEHTSYLDRPVAAGAAETELLTISCRLTKTGDELVFDYDDSDEQSAAYGMATRAGTVGAVATLMLCLFGSELPWNHGLMRPVTVKARDGLCVTAQPPMPVSGGAAGANWVAMSAAAGCIAKMVSFSDDLRGLAFGPGDGSWQLGQFGGLNQYGEPFAAMYMDSLLWGGPAFADRDGVDSGGAMVILGGGTQDVEQHEVGQPLLYLWRREVPDSGGAGRNRGGNGIEFALVPYDTDEVSGVLATHGTSLPNRTGIFGGYPGSTGRYELVTGVDALAELGAGRAITALDEAGGEHVVLPGVTSGAVVRRGEIVNVRLQNGGGYGDPLDREPERVLRDVLDGAVTPATARDLYGVVTTGDAVDAAATDARRRALRDERLAAMTPPDPSASGGPAATPEGRWGDALRLVHRDGRSVACCAHCDHELGAVGADWRALTGTLELRPEQVSPLVTVHDELAVHQQVCPSCAASLWVEVRPRAGAPWTDFALRPAS